MVFERGFELHDEVRESAHGYCSSGDGVLPEGGCPCEGGSLSHVGESESDLFVVGVVDLVIDEEVELYGVQPLGGFVVRSVKGFRYSDAEFSGFQGGHGRRWSGERWGGK